MDSNADSVQNDQSDREVPKLAKINDSEMKAAASVYNTIFNLIINKYSAYLDDVARDQSNLLPVESVVPKAQKTDLCQKISQFGTKGHPLIIEIFLLPPNHSREKLKSLDDRFPALLVEQWSVQLVPMRLIDKSIVEMKELVDELSGHFENSSLSKWLVKQTDLSNRPKLIYRITNLHNSCQINPNWISITPRDLLPNEHISLVDRELLENDYGSPNKLYYLNSPNDSPKSKSIYQVHLPTTQGSSSPTLLKERFLSNDYIKTSRSFSCARINSTDVLEIIVFSVKEFPNRPIFYEIEEDSIKNSSSGLEEFYERTATPEKIRRLDDSEFNSCHDIYGSQTSILLEEPSRKTSQPGNNNIERIITSLSTLTTQQTQKILGCNQVLKLTGYSSNEKPEEEDDKKLRILLEAKTPPKGLIRPTGLSLSSSPIPNRSQECRIHPKIGLSEIKLFLAQFSNYGRNSDAKETCQVHCDSCGNSLSSSSGLTSPVAAYSFNVPRLTTRMNVPSIGFQTFTPSRYRSLKRSDERVLSRPGVLLFKSSRSNDGTPRSLSFCNENTQESSLQPSNISSVQSSPTLHHKDNTVTESSSYGKPSSEEKKESITDCLSTSEPSPSNYSSSTGGKKIRMNSRSKSRDDAIDRESKNFSYPCTCQRNAFRSRNAQRLTTPSNNLLVNFEESMLNGRIKPYGIVDGFEVELGASGSFFPRHARLSMSSYFFQLSNDNAPSPYLGFVDFKKLSNRKGYQIPKSGAVQLTLFNPNKSVVKMFLIGYDFSDMPSNSQTFLRHRTFSVPVGSKSPTEGKSWITKLQPTSSPAYITSCSPTSIMIVSKWYEMNSEKPGGSAVKEDDKKTIKDTKSSQAISSNLRYSIHLKFYSSKTSRIYLHSDIRMIFSRDDKCEPDTGTDNYGPISYELYSYVEAPSNPRYSNKH